MTKTEVLDVRLKACRPHFKAGADLSGKVNRITLNIDQTKHTDMDKECLDIDLKWEVEAELAECPQ